MAKLKLPQARDKVNSTKQALQAESDAVFNWEFEDSFAEHRSDFLKKVSTFDDAVRCALRHKTAIVTTLASVDAKTRN